MLCPREPVQRYRWDTFSCLDHSGEILLKSFYAEEPPFSKSQKARCLLAVALGLEVLMEERVESPSLVFMWPHSGEASLSLCEEEMIP